MTLFSTYGGRAALGVYFPLGAWHSPRVRTAQSGAVRKEELFPAPAGLAAACLGHRVGQAPVCLHRSWDCGFAGSGQGPGIGLAGLAASLFVVLVATLLRAWGTPAECSGMPILWPTTRKWTS